MKNERIKHFLIGFPIAYLALTFIAFSINVYGDFLQNRANEIVKNAPVTDYFLYEDVVYTGQTDEGFLRFESTRTIFKPIDVEWIDTLKCEVKKDTGTFELYSEKHVVGDISPKDSRVATWVYDQAYPLDTLCYLESDIKGKVGGYPKEQEVIGEPFKTPPFRTPKIIKEEG